MNTNAHHEREIRAIAIAANCGEASDDQIARLDELIRSDRSLANYAARLLDQQALAWQGSMETLRADQAPLKEAASNESSRENEISIAETRRGRPSRVRQLLPHAAQRASWAWPTIAVGIGFLLGGLTAAGIYRSMRSEGDVIAASADTPTNAARPYDARLIGGTACLWDGNSNGSRQIGSGLSSGESVHLLEGLAQFELQWRASGSAKLSLEGPAAMMLNSEGMPTLRFGRLTASIHTSFRPFVLETSVGRLVLAEYGSIGVSAFGNEGEIHVFAGSAILEPAWPTPDEPAEPLAIEAGQAIRFEAGESGQPSITRHSSDSDYFTAQVSMNSDGLAIRPEYVKAIKQAAPIGYWRFERDQWPHIPNVMGDSLECRVNGAMGRTAHRGNQAVDFGVTNEDGDIVSDQTIDNLIDDSYSIEFWIKPSHYHVGAVVSLVGETPMSDGILPHGMLIELGGTGRIPTASNHPGCIRFLHRSPAGTADGTSCYSKSPYTLRKWQHVVAAKDGPQMRLYVNGQLVAEGTNANPLPSGLRLLVGRLYPSQNVRPFIGQLDELALYNRVLTPEEIERHYQLVHPKVVAGGSI